jgi:hypothetical protein
MQRARQMMQASVATEHQPSEQGGEQSREQPAE